MDVGACSALAVTRWLSLAADVVSMEAADRAGEPQGDGSPVLPCAHVLGVGQVLEGLDIVSRPPSSRGSQRTPAHHSAPYACDREVNTVSVSDV